jgi:hypothetical protein
MLAQRTQFPERYECGADLGADEFAEKGGRKSVLDAE